MTDRRGFTITELLVVAILGSLIVLAAYQVLIVNQRTYTAQSAQVQSQQNARAAMDILFSELRELSSGNSDIKAVGEQFIQIRTMRGIGVVCDNFPMTWGTTPQLLVRPLTDWFEAGDSIFIFADNDETKVSDDVWIEGLISATDTTRTCVDPGDAQLMTFTAQAAAFLGDTVRVGGAVRNFTTYRYSLASYDGETYLGRAEEGDGWEPLVGPLTGFGGAPGLTFEYYNAAGSQTAILDDIVRIDVTVRATTFVRDANGNLVGDSIRGSVYMRN